ncbi:hypothetical protein VTK26DRAFT_2878 [Humicola hyalothermophila]
MRCGVDAGSECAATTEWTVTLMYLFAATGELGQCRIRHSIMSMSMPSTNWTLLGTALATQRGAVTCPSLPDSNKAPRLLVSPRPICWRRASSCHERTGGPLFLLDAMQKRDLPAGVPCFGRRLDRSFESRRAGFTRSTTPSPWKNLDSHRG